MPQHTDAERIALAEAWIAQDPDPETRHELAGIVDGARSGDTAAALDLADRVVILKDGQIVQQGTPQQVCRDPQSAFVMKFLGDANVLAAEVRDGRAHAGGAADDQRPLALVVQSIQQRHDGLP